MQLVISQSQILMLQLQSKTYYRYLNNQLIYKFQGSNEWKNIQDIVKLTFKAVCDVIRSQGLAIRELERIVPTKANKSELNAGLSVKANVSDVSRTIAEIASSIENKLTFEEVQNIIDDKVSKTDL